MRFSVLQVVGLCILILLGTVYFYDRYQESQASGYMPLTAPVQGPPEWAPEPYTRSLSLSGMETHARLLKRGKVTAIVQNRSSTTGYQNITVQLRYLNANGETLKMKEVVLDKVLYPGDADNIAVFQTAPLLATNSTLEIVSADAFKP